MATLGDTEHSRAAADETPSMLFWSGGAEGVLSGARATDPAAVPFRSWHRTHGSLPGVLGRREARKLRERSQSALCTHREVVHPDVEAAVYESGFD